MIRRFWALIAKEMLQHWIAGLALSALLACGYGLVLLTFFAARRATTVFQYEWFFLVFFLPIAAATLGNRLVVAEWHARTQLFVEALPIRRGEMALAKLVLGLFTLLGVSYGTLAVSALLAGPSEPVDARFAGILIARTSGFVLCLWSLAFTMGLLGRLRIPIYVFAGLALLAVLSTSDVQLKKFGPFALVDPETYPTERTELPVEALAQSGAVAFALLLLGFMLLMIREGSLAESLSRRMTQKEKATVGVIFCLGLVGIAWLEKKKAKQPFAFTDPAVVRSSGIEVLYVQEKNRPAAESLLRDLGRDLGELKNLLQWDALPPVRVAFRPDLDARTFERARIERADGVLVRANFTARNWDPRAFTAYVLRETLLHRTKGRADFEPKRWVHDGFSRWWAERGNGRASKAWARALWASVARPPSEERLARWTRSREETGEAIAEGLAFSGLSILEERHGVARVEALAKALYGRTPYEDSREVLWERDHPMAKLFEEATGVAWSAFLVEWSAALEAARASDEGRALLAKVPSAEAELALEEGEGDVRAIRYRFTFANSPEPGTVCALVHSKLGPFDYELSPNDLHREEHAWSGDRSRSFQLAGHYNKGERAFLALEVESLALDAPLRLVARRSELR